LKDFLRYYLEVSEVSSFEDLQELMLIEQFKESLSDSVRSFVEARKPKTAAEAAMYADTCYESSCHSKSSKQRSDDKRPEHKKGGNRRAPPLRLRVHQRQMPLRKQATMRRPLLSVRHIRVVSIAEI